MPTTTRANSEKLLAGHRSLLGGLQFAHPCTSGFLKYSGVALGIFRLGVDSSDEGAKISAKMAFHFLTTDSDWVIDYD